MLKYFILTFVPFFNRLFYRCLYIKLLLYLKITYVKKVNMSHLNLLLHRTKRGVMRFGIVSHFFLFNYLLRGIRRTSFCLGVIVFKIYISFVSISLLSRPFDFCALRNLISWCSFNVLLTQLHKGVMFLLTKKFIL